MKQNKAFLAVAVSTLVLCGGILTGCSEQTKDAASNTVEGAAQDTVNNTAAAGEAVGGAVKETGEAVAGAGEAVGGAVVKTGEDAMETGEKMASATDKAVENTGEAVVGAGKMAGEAVKGVGKEVEDGAQVVTLTPAVKAALIKSKIDGSTVNVNTSGEKDTVVLKGTVKSASEKTLAAQIAMKVIKEQGQSFKLKNELTIAP